MVRKPKRRKTTHVDKKRSTQTTIFYVISVLVILSMAVGLVISILARSASPALPPSSALLGTALFFLWGPA